MHTAPSPVGHEYEDLHSFLWQRHKKKQQEKEEKRQPKITNFFTRITRIKQEPTSHDYDGDDERGASPAIMIRASCMPSPAIRASHTPSPRTANNEAKPKSSPRNARSRESPRLLNRLAHHHMPEGTFIPISTTFKFIADSRRAAVPASRNLLETFDKLPISSKDPPVAMQSETSVAIDIVPTGQASPSPLNVSDEGSGLMMNEITQTDNADILPIFCTHKVQTDSLVESKEVQTFVSEMTTTESQTECHVMEKSMQTEIEVTTEEKENQTEKTNEDQSIQTDIEVTMEEKENQTEKNNQEQSIQTDIEVTMEEKENQTEKNNQDQSIQTEISSHEKSNETDINSSNILTVNRIELVEEMHSWGTQTDVSELESMDPITPVQCLVATDYVEQLNAQVKENLSETDSVVSSASKLEVSSVSLAAKLQELQRQTASAGLDMHMGKYHELEFPPVS